MIAASKTAKQEKPDKEAQQVSAFSPECRLSDSSALSRSQLHWLDVYYMYRLNRNMSSLSPVSIKPQSPEHRLPTNDPLNEILGGCLFVHMLVTDNSWWFAMLLHVVFTCDSKSLPRRGGRNRYVTLTAYAYGVLDQIDSLYPLRINHQCHFDTPYLNLRSLHIPYCYSLYHAVICLILLASHAQLHKLYLAWKANSHDCAWNSLPACLTSFL